MGPEDFERYRAAVGLFQRSLGLRAWLAVVNAKQIWVTYGANAEELERPLRDFLRPETHLRFHVDNRAELDRYLVHVARRLYNHLATAVSIPAHLSSLGRRLPAKFEPARTRIEAAIGDFRNGDCHRIAVRLRDHSIHDRLHVTTAHFELRQASDDPHGAWESAGRIMLQTGPVRSVTPRRKRRDKAQDPLIGLHDEIDLLGLVREHKAATMTMVRRILNELLGELRRHAADLAARAERVAELEGTNDK